MRGFIKGKRQRISTKSNLNEYPYFRKSVVSFYMILNEEKSISVTPEIEDINPAIDQVETFNALECAPLSSTEDEFLEAFTEVNQHLVSKVGLFFNQES